MRSRLLRQAAPAAEPPRVLPMSNDSLQTNTETDVRTDDKSTEALGQIRRALSGLRYGTVCVVVQDGVVVQVERTEKIRLRR